VQSGRYCSYEERPLICICAMFLSKQPHIPVSDMLSWIQYSGFRIHVQYDAPDANDMAASKHEDCIVPYYSKALSW
jgi:hypothetical protein